jgi:(R,R)-butanediol dehydrogenase / meso-butanediol dehydrogenase / diacetyl reductase
MKAAIVQGLHQPLIVGDVADPTPGEGEVVVCVARCGICGSDLHMTEDPIYGIVAGDVIGHEFAGEIVALGKGVAGLKLGDRVAVVPLKSCGSCDHCVKGEVQWCSGFGLQGGGYAEYALTRPNQCVLLPASAGMDDGAIVEPLAVALHGVNLSGVKAGDKVLVLGAGPIGLAVAFWCHRKGASDVVVQDITDFQRDRALAMGASGFSVDVADPIGNAERVLGGKADVVFECVGLPGLIEQAISQVRNRGTILLLGLCTRPDTFNSFAMLQKEVRLVTSAFFTLPEFQAALDVLNAGAAEPRHLVTDTISLDDTPLRFEALRTRSHDCKVLIAP